MDNALFHDAPLDAAVMPDSEALFIESGGSRMFGRILLPARQREEDTCPVILMAHGYPGNEKNYDLAQLFRMAGLAAVYFSYRGVWGSKGTYSPSHIIEDTLSAAEHIRSLPPEMHVDPRRLYVFGHSMGGFAMVNALAAGMKARGAFLMSPCDFSAKYLRFPDSFQKLNDERKEGYFTLEKENAIEEEMALHAPEWSFLRAAEQMDTGMPYFFIGGTRDTATPAKNHIFPLMEALKKRGAQVNYLELEDSHDYPGSRFRVAEHVVTSIAALEGRSI